MKEAFEFSLIAHPVLEIKKDYNYSCTKFNIFVEYQCILYTFSWYSFENKRQKTIIIITEKKE